MPGVPNFESQLRHALPHGVTFASSEGKTPHDLLMRHLAHPGYSEFQEKVDRRPQKGKDYGPAQIMDRTTIKE